MSRVEKVLIVLAAAWAAIACTAMPAPTSATPSPTTSALLPTPIASSTAGAVPTLGTPCRADITMSGDYSGNATGQITSDVRHIGDGDAGVAIDTWFDIPQNGAPTQFMLSIWDGDGPGPKPIVALAGKAKDFDARGWEADQDPTSATLADDGSSATFDMAFTRLGNGPKFTLVGSLTCEPAH